jgi:hypothetical protein
MLPNGLTAGRQRDGLGFAAGSGLAAARPLCTPPGGLACHLSGQ